MRTTSDLVVVALLVAIVGWLGWWAGRAPVPEYVKRVESLTVVLDSTRAVYASARRETDTVVRRVRVAAYRAADADVELGRAIDTARVALETDSTLALRVALADLVRQAEAYRGEVLTYQAHVDTLVRAHLAERQAAAQELEAARAVVDVQAGALEAGRCSTLFGPCPTRRHSFALGALVAAVVLALL